jgi:hypothetical protein
VTVGITATEANAILEAIYGGSAYSGFADTYLQLHTGDPGAAGTSNASAETERKSITPGSPSGGSMVCSEAEWSAWDAGAETISHVSVWSASTSGTYIRSIALTAGKALTNGDTIGITVTFTLGPIAA